ncbi:hypothetical protein [Thermococcus aciditolerans]|uniref:hypothetical protein n=1 Tax=Thermococcus aciditolerans TaxID=2598455 RepID=UPI00143D7ACE|nr:hypothetical protein [Thermococcus aciditolerans]
MVKEMGKKVVDVKKLKTVDGRTLVVEYYEDGSWKVVRVIPELRRTGAWRKAVKVVG